MPESQNTSEIAIPKGGWLAGAIPLLVFVAIAVFQIGPILPDVLEGKILPLVRKLQKQKDVDQ